MYNIYNIHIHTIIHSKFTSIYSLPFSQAFHCYVLMEKKKSKPIDWCVYPRSEALNLEYSPYVDSCLHLVQNIECAT